MDPNVPLINGRQIFPVLRNAEVLFLSDDTCFSHIYEGYFERGTTPWEDRKIKLFADGVLVIVKGSNSKITPYDLEITHLDNCCLHTFPHFLDRHQVGIEITNRDFLLSHKSHGEIHEISYRFIISATDLLTLAAHLKSLHPELDQLSFDHDPRFSCAETPTIHMTPQDQLELAKAMDESYRKHLCTTIVSKRRAFRWLPPLCRSDLLHGSWWYVIGSFLSVVISLIVLVNDYETFLGADDSILPPPDYRLAWGLCLASAVLFTIGSVAFVRASNSPPLSTMGLCACCASDEIFGSWFAVSAVLPAVPYCFVYMTVSHSLLYFIAMIVSIAIVVFMIIFIRFYYGKAPAKATGHEPPKSYFLDASRRYFLHESRRNVLNWMEVHCATDWLVVTWIVYWGTAVGSLLFLLLFLYELIHGSLNNISIFVYVTRSVLNINAHYFLVLNLDALIVVWRIVFYF